MEQLHRMGAENTRDSVTYIGKSQIRRMLSGMRLQLLADGAPLRYGRGESPEVIARWDIIKRLEEWPLRSDEKFHGEQDVRGWFRQLDSMEASELANWLVDGAQQLIRLAPVLRGKDENVRMQIVARGKDMFDRVVEDPPLADWYCAETQKVDLPRIAKTYRKD